MTGEIARQILTEFSDQLSVTFILLPQQIKLLLFVTTVKEEPNQVYIQ